jgi:hypothetical protein
LLTTTTLTLDGGWGSIARAAGNSFNETNTNRFSNTYGLHIVCGANNGVHVANGANPQSVSVYNTHTSGTSLERVKIGWSSNVCTIGTEAGSAGGSVRSLQIGAGPSGARATFATGRFDISTAGSWSIGSSVSASAYSTFAIGDNSSAPSQQSFSIGFFTTTYTGTQFSRSTVTKPWNIGQTQTSEFRAYQASTSASPFELIWNGNIANRWVIPNKRVLSCRLRIVGVENVAGTANVVTFDRKLCAGRPNSTMTIFGGVQTIGTDVDTVGTAALSISADTTNNCLNIQITPPNANEWMWYATLYAEDLLKVA